MKNNKIYMTTALYPATQDDFEKLYDIHWLDSAEALANVPPGWSEKCEVLVTSSGRGIEKTVLEKLHGLKLVANFGTGVEKIDLAYCKEKAISVTHTPGVGRALRELFQNKCWINSAVKVFL